MEVRVGVPSKALVRRVASWPPSRVRPLVSVACNITRAYRGAPQAVPRHPSDSRCCEPWTGITTRVPGAAAAAAAASLLLLQASAAGAYEQGAAEFFNPEAYAGRWYEVASLKKGFAGEGQQDCHCTQGIYSLQQDDAEAIRLQVNTFCVHGGPQGRLSGIRGSVSCANPALLQLLPEFESQLEQAEGIAEKCVLRFDSLPFLPAEPYDVIRTDYTSYALVQGAKDTSFVQIYSRTPNPGPEFIAAQKRVLGELGYPAEQIVDTPQDCEEMPPQMLMAAMEAGMKGRDLMPASTPPQQAMRGYDLGPASGIAFDSVRDPLQSIKDIFSLFKM